VFYYREKDREKKIENERGKGIRGWRHWHGTRGLRAQLFFRIKIMKIFMS